MITSRQWHAYEEALLRSEAQWAQEDERLKTREQPLPAIKIGDVTRGDYTPQIEYNDK